MRPCRGTSGAGGERVAAARPCPGRPVLSASLHRSLTLISKVTDRASDSMEQGVSLATGLPVGAGARAPSTLPGLPVIPPLLGGGAGHHSSHGILQERLLALTLAV